MAARSWRLVDRFVVWRLVERFVVWRLVDRFVVWRLVDRIVVEQIWDILTVSALAWPTVNASPSIPHTDTVSAGAAVFAPTAERHIYETVKAVEQVNDGETVKQRG